MIHQESNFSFLYYIKHKNRGKVVNQKIEVEKKTTIDNITHFGKECAIEILNNGGNILMQQIKNKL